MPLPTHQRPCGDLFGGEQNHPEYDPAHPAGYETASTGLMMVGAREYDPEIGRFLQPDPQPTGPELQWGQLNRWAYCANDPVNASDPSGEAFLQLLGLLMGVIGIGLMVGALFMEPGIGKDLTQLAGSVLLFLAGLTLGNWAGVATALAQLRMVTAAVLARILPLLAVLLATILGFADKCTREAARHIRTLTDFMNFARDLWDRYALLPQPDEVDGSFPTRLEVLWLDKRMKAA